MLVAEGCLSIVTVTESPGLTTSGTCWDAWGRVSIQAWLQRLPDPGLIQGTGLDRSRLVTPPMPTPGGADVRRTGGVGWDGPGASDAGVGPAALGGGVAGPVVRGVLADWRHPLRSSSELAKGRVAGACAGWSSAWTVQEPPFCTSVYTLVSRDCMVVPSLKVVIQVS